MSDIEPIPDRSTNRSTHEPIVIEFNDRRIDAFDRPDGITDASNASDIVDIRRLLNKMRVIVVAVAIIVGGGVMGVTYAINLTD